MGFWTTVTVDGITVDASRNQYNAGILSLFSEDERAIASVLPPGTARRTAGIVLDPTRDAGESAGLASPSSQLGQLAEDDDWEDEEGSYVELKVTYSAPARVIRDRLDVTGYTMQAARAAFVAAWDGMLSEVRSADYRPQWPQVAWSLEELATLERVSFDEWLNALRELWAQSAQALRDRDVLSGEVAELPELKRFMLWGPRPEGCGWPSDDEMLFLRCVLEVCPAELCVTQDLTGMTSQVDSEYVDQPYADMARQALGPHFALQRRVFVLPEGKFDSRILRRCLALLYPHVADYFTFMDYEAVKTDGSAGHVVNTLKVLAALGVPNRVIGLFDNDTAARDSVRALSKVGVPANLKCCHLPELALARCYPTLGPSGPSSMDVNGLACSIELYFGTDVLLQGDGTLVPVQWTGYVPSLQRYQGAVTQKETLQRRFEEKLQRAEAEPELSRGPAWDDMRLVMQQLMTAFDEPVN